MSEPTNPEKNPAGTGPAEIPENQDPKNPVTPSNPVKEALAAENSKKRPEIDRATHSLKSTAERLKQLGGDPAKVLGISSTPPSFEGPNEEDDTRPLTVGEFKRMQQEDNQRTAVQLADRIENEDERELAKSYLRTRIRPSGDPEADLADAMALVNRVKNNIVVSEIKRGSSNVARRHSTGSGSPHASEDAFIASEEEIMAAKIAHVSPERMEEWIKNARSGTGVKFGTAAKKRKEAESKGR